MHENICSAIKQLIKKKKRQHTKDDKDPKNLILLCTTQGLAVQQDGRGMKKLFHHSVSANGKVQRHWLEAERSAHKVGGAQKETAAEKV